MRPGKEGKGGEGKTAAGVSSIVRRGRKFVSNHWPFQFHPNSLPSFLLLVSQSVSQGNRDGILLETREAARNLRSGDAVGGMVGWFGLGSAKTHFPPQTGGFLELGMRKIDYHSQCLIWL